MFGGGALRDAAAHRQPSDRRCFELKQLTILIAMDDPDDLALAMFALAIAPIMLVAGGLYLVRRPDPPKSYSFSRHIIKSRNRQAVKRAALLEVTVGNF